MKRKFFMNWNQFYFMSILTVFLISVTVVIPKHAMDLEYKAWDSAYAQDSYNPTDQPEESGGSGSTIANVDDSCDSSARHGFGMAEFGGQKLSEYPSGGKLHETTLQLLEARAEFQIVDN